MSDDRKLAGWSAPTHKELVIQGNLRVALMGIMVGWPRHKVAAWYSRKARRAVLRHGS